MRILVVDDSSDYRELLTLLLGQELGSDLEIRTASNGQGAIALLETEPAFDLIVCDYVMDNGSGADVFAYLQAVGRLDPFLLYSSYVGAYAASFVGDSFLGAVDKADVSRLKAVIRAQAALLLAPMP